MFADAACSRWCAAGWFRQRSSGGAAERGEPQDHRHWLRTIGAHEYRGAATLLGDFWTTASAALRGNGVILGQLIKVGIARFEAMKARTIAVSRGDQHIAPDELNVWFPSTESFAKVLSSTTQTC